MAKLLITMLAILLASVSELDKHVSPTFLESYNYKYGQSTELDVFKPGRLPTTKLNVDVSTSSRRIPLSITRPTAAGKYAVLLFFHGFCLKNSYYSELFKHIASHGYIVVAPQIYSCPIDLFIDGQNEVDLSIEVANCLPSGLNSVLEGSVIADSDKLAISGHSRGGKAAFAVHLRLSNVILNTTFSALVSLDPVAGFTKERKPKFFTYEPDSLDLSIPVTVIGTGLGSQRSGCFLGICIIPACARYGLNHAEFYDECKRPASHFVVRDYGHLDMLDDNLDLDFIYFMADHACTKNVDKPDKMRRTVGGIIVAFLKAYLYRSSRDYTTILQNDSVYPSVVDHEYKSKTAEYLAQI